jgi:hypothetical protein
LHHLPCFRQGIIGKQQEVSSQINLTILKGGDKDRDKEGEAERKTLDKILSFDTMRIEPCRKAQRISRGRDMLLIIRYALESGL